MDVIERPAETGWTVFSLTGRFDAHESDAVQGQLHESIERGDVNIDVDLSEVNFIDSSALAVLTSAMKRCREAAGDLRIVSPSAPVRVIFELTRLDRAFTIC